MSDPSPETTGTQSLPNTTPPLLSVEGLTVRFAGVTALSDVSFVVQPGELFAVIGPNGAGKTSLFNILSRIYQPAAGRITFNGGDLLRLKTHQTARAGIARTFQNLGQFPHTTVLDYMLLGRHTHMRSGILLGGIYLGRAVNEEKVNRAYCMRLLELLGLERYYRLPLGRFLMACKNALIWHARWRCSQNSCCWMSR